jgi:hypothetical protein
MLSAEFNFMKGGALISIFSPRLSIPKSLFMNLARSHMQGIGSASMAPHR